MSNNIFRHDNTSGYSVAELDALNTKWDEIVAAESLEPDTDEYTNRAKQFSDEVSKAADDGTRYSLSASYDDNGQRCICDRPYALGEYADATFATGEDAEEAAEELRDGIGDIVDASVLYFVNED